MRPYDWLIKLTSLVITGLLLAACLPPQTNLPQPAGPMGYE